LAEIEQHRLKKEQAALAAAKRSLPPQVVKKSHLRRYKICKIYLDRKKVSNNLEQVLLSIYPYMVFIRMCDFCSGLFALVPPTEAIHAGQSASPFYQKKELS
jgi:hypothetical protein